MWIVREKEIDRIIGDKSIIQKARKYPVGTIREWKGQKFKKKPSGKWVQVTMKSPRSIENRPMPKIGKFNAVAYYDKTNDPNVTTQSILKNVSPEVKQKISATESKLKDITQTVSNFRQSGEGASAVYSPARQKIHNKIIDKILSPEVIKNAKSDNPKIIMLGGRGGSGKSWFKGNVYNPSQAVVLDSDEIKGMLPEYQGWNAFEVHEESSDILEKVMETAKAAGLNIVIDATLKSPKGAIARANDFKKKWI